MVGIHEGLLTDPKSIWPLVRKEDCDIWPQNRHLSFNSKLWGSHLNEHFTVTNWTLFKTKSIFKSKQYTVYYGTFNFTIVNIVTVVQWVYFQLWDCNKSQKCVADNLMNAALQLFVKSSAQVNGAYNYKNQMNLNMQLIEFTAKRNGFWCFLGHINLC
jgi:hypothetical protein